MAKQSDEGRGGASLDSLPADRVKRMADRMAEGGWLMAPQTLARTQVTGPAVKAPSLDNLQVKVPAFEPLKEEDLLGRLHELALEHASKRDRAPGEAVRMGDMVLLDTLGYAEGRLIPFSARSELELEMAPQTLFPGFCEALEGAPVGDGREFELIVPDDYPIEALRGVKATFLVDVLAAQQLELPEPDSAEFLQALGRGDSLEEVLEALADELADEQAEEMWLEAQEQVLDELVLRTGEVQLPPGLVDEEIQEQWGADELPMLQEKDFDEDELQEALEGWLEDPDTRVDAERRLRVSLALKAVIDAERLQLTPAQPEGPSRDVATHLMAVDFVMSRARIQFEGVEGTFPGRPQRV